MPISFKLYEEHELFLSKWVGEISDSDLLQSYKQLFDNEKYKPGFDEIADTRNANIAGVTSEGLMSLFIMVQQNISGKCESFKTAVIAPKDLEFDMARIYEVFSDDSNENVMVFRSIDSALNWLGIEGISIR